MKKKEKAEFEFTHKHDGKTYKFKFGTGPTILEELKNQLSPELYEKIIQPGFLDKILKANASLKLPPNTQRDRYFGKCKFQKIAYELDQKYPKMTIREMMEHPEIKAIFEAESILSESGQRAWIRPVIKIRGPGRPKNK